MGVQGLTSFVDENPVLLTDLHLHNTRVLVDGNNLCYFLYFNYYDINLRYGGDYDIYAESLRCYFKTLRTCNVEPYIIFDGAYENKRKLRTSLSRSRDRLLHATRIANGHEGHILPLLSFETFQNVLTELEIKHMRIDFEADDQLAALANEWACPVMSNDSDFFIFSLKGGFIIFDYLNLEIRQGIKDGVPFKYLNVQIYYLDTLLSCYKGMDHDKVALFATLMGNDYVERNHFNNFFAKAKLPESPLSSTRRSHGRMASLLSWLETAPDVESAISTISSYIPDDRQKSVQDLILTSVKYYTCIQSDLKDYFENGECKIKNKNRWKSYANQRFPEWLVGRLRRNEVPLYVLNTLVGRRLMLHCQVEVMNYPSSFEVATNLHMVLFSILATLDNLSDKKSSKERFTVNMYDREKKNMRWKKVGTFHQLPDGTPIPDLHLIPDLTQTERERILLTSMGVPPDRLAEIPSALRLFVAVICYWVVHSNPSVPIIQVYGLVLSVINLSLRQSMTTKKDLVPRLQEMRKDGSCRTTEGVRATQEDDHELILLKSLSEAASCEATLRKVDHEPIVLKSLSEAASCEATLRKDDHEPIVSKSLSEAASCEATLRKEDHELIVWKSLSEAASCEATLRTEDHAVEIAPNDCVHVKGTRDDNPDSNNSMAVNDSRDETAASETQAQTVWVPPNAVFDELILSCNDKDRIFAVKNLEKFSAVSRKYEKSQFKTTVIHGFAQFQASLQAGTYLNMLLCCPLPCLSPASIYNGTFLYNLTVELQRWVDPKDYIFGQLGRKSPLCDIWMKLVNTVVSIVPTDSFATIKEGFKVAKKKMPVKEPQRPRHTSNDQSDSRLSSLSDDDSTFTSVKTKCKLTNRFSGLVLEDS